MSSNRIEWTCPECSKRFAIPADIDTPERCPECTEAVARKDSDQKQKKTNRSQEPNQIDAERIEWTCPGCHQRFAIPGDIETPALCPECEKLQNVSPSSELPPPSTALPESPAEQLAPLPANTPQELVSVLPELPKTFVSSPRIQRLLANKYPALRLIVMFYKGVGVLLFILTIILTVVFTIQGIQHNMAVAAPSQFVNSFATIFFFLIGTFASVGCYASGELISVLIDIESNTRRHKLE